MTAPDKTLVAPEKTAVAPQKTAVAPQQAAAASDKANEANGKVINSGAEADIELVIRNGKPYALKRYHKGFHPNTKINEALRHLGGKGFIADIYETGKTPDGQEYELMEYMPAGSLARYDLRGNEAAITTIVLRVAIALDACHRSKVIHKDIKPANILVRDTSVWDCVLCDFGIAGIMNCEGKAITKQLRTPIYAAPEIYDPKCAKARIDGVDLFEITPAADFYSLGMTALCLWSGEDTFRASEEKIVIEKLSRGITLPQDMPERLKAIVKGLLKKDPSKRWKLKDITESLGGHWAVMHTLNPLSDVKLNSNPDSKDYAMTGVTIGAFLNKVYMWQFADAKAPADDKICQAVVDSFSIYEGSYMQLFFAGKGDRFKSQDSWMRYCCNWEEGDNARKAGPRDEDTRLEISMMKTIKGFGFTPYYEFEDDTVKSIDELKNVDPYDKKHGLSHGLKGWLAVQYHEDPEADLGKEHAYEDLLDAYVLKIGEIDPEAEEYTNYSYACNKAEELYNQIVDTMKKNRRRIDSQTVSGILFVILAQIIAFSHILNCSGEGVLWPCIMNVRIITIVIFNLQYVLFKTFKYEINYTYNGPDTDKTVAELTEGKAPEVGYEELVVEPLYYAFSDEKYFDSSLYGILENSIYKEWGDYIKERGKWTIGGIVESLISVALAFLTMH